MNLSELEQKTISELHKIAKDLELTGCSRLRKKELIFEIMKANTEKDGLMFAQGILKSFRMATVSCALSPTFPAMMTSMFPLHRSGALTCEQVTVLPDR